MLILVGSTNPTKIGAVTEAFAAHEAFRHATVEGVQVQNPEFGHPKNIEETVTGAMERAMHAFKDCTYSVGIEAGLIDVPHTKTGHMEIAACARFARNPYPLRLSPGLEWPTRALSGILQKGLDGSQALRDAGLTDHPKLGTAGGIIGVLTDGTVSRQKQNEMAVHMALTHLLHPEFYESSTMM